MRCTQNYRIYTVFSITIGLHRISTLEHVMSVSREVLLTCHSGGDSEIRVRGLRPQSPKLGLGWEKSTSHFCFLPIGIIFKILP